MSQGLLSEEDFAKAAEKTGVPLPSEVAPDAQKFEQWIAGGIAPLIGLNLCLFGCLRLGRLGQNLLPVSAVSVALGAMAMFAVYRRARARSYADYFAVGLAGCLLASSLAAPNFFPLAALVAVGGLFALVLTQRVHGRAFALFACWLLPLIDQAKVPLGVLFASLLLAPPAVLLARRRFFGAAFVVIVVVLAQAGVELVRHEHGQLIGVLLCGIALGLAVLYELVVPVREFSTFRMLLGQLPVVAALVLVVRAAEPHGVSLRFAVWVTSAAIVAYQMLRTYLERAAIPARLSWVGVAAAAAAVAELEVPSASTCAVACQVVFVAVALHMAGVALSAAMLADAGVALLACVLGGLLSSWSTDLGFVVTMALTGVGLLLASARFPATASLPWWSGFIRQRHALVITDITRKVLKRATDLTFVKIFFGWLSLAVVWLRFALQAANKSDIRPFVNLSGHATLALGVIPNLVDWLETFLPRHERGFHVTLSTMLTNVYGVLLFARGMHIRRRFTRLLGLVLVLAPAVRQALTSKSMRLDDLSWQLLTTGSCLAAIGLLVKRADPVELADPSPATSALAPPKLDGGP